MAKKADEVYVRLRDKSTSFHDGSQGKNIVADRIEIMKRTALVGQALHHKVLDEVSEEEYEAYQAKRSGKPTAAVVEAKASTTTTDTVAAPAKKKETVAAPAKKKETVAAPAKKTDLTADDDDEELEDS